MTDDEIAVLVAGTVETLKAGIVGLPLDYLQRVRAAEAGKPDDASRTTALAAIDAAIAALPPVDLEKASGRDDEWTEGANVYFGKTLIRVGDGPTEQDKLEKTLADLGYGEGGPEDATIVDRAIYVLLALDDDRTKLKADLAEAPAAIAHLQSDRENPSIAEFAGVPLSSLQALRTLAIAHRAGQSEIDAIDAAIADLQAKAADAPAIDPNDTASRIVPTRAVRDALAGGDVLIVLTDAGTAIEGVPKMPVASAQFRFSGDRAIFERVLRVDRDVAPATITHVELVDNDGVVGVCEIPGDLSVGGGREAEFPAGSLIF